MEVEDDLREFAHLWDGSENWVLHASRWTKVILTIVFAGATPTVQELVALRRLRAEFRALPVSELKTLLAGQREIRLSRYPDPDAYGKMSLVRGQGRIELDGFTVQKARKLEEIAAGLQVPFTIHSRIESGVSYSPIQHCDGEQFFMLIEDAELAERVEREMLKRGVPVVFDAEE